MPLRWRSKPRFDVPRPASGRLPARSGRSTSCWRSSTIGSVTEDTVVQKQFLSTRQGRCIGAHLGRELRQSADISSASVDAIMVSFNITRIP